MTDSSDYEINPVMYVNLWKTSQKCLSVYAKSTSVQDDNHDNSGDHTDTCIERIVRIVSSGDKADQMKARRDHAVVYVTNPMMTR